jgi:hypothetical protein
MLPFLLPAPPPLAPAASRAAPCRRRPLLRAFLPAVPLGLHRVARRFLPTLWQEPVRSSPTGEHGGPRGDPWPASMAARAEIPDRPWRWPPPLPPRPSASRELVHRDHGGGPGGAPPPPPMLVSGGAHLWAMVAFCSSLSRTAGAIR